MRLLGIDVGSSSVKAGVLLNGKVVGKITHSTFNTDYSADRAEVDAFDVLDAVTLAIRDLGKSVRTIDCIAFSVMAPSWLAMDADGKPLTPVVTHQDRRSIEVAKEIELRVGKARHLKLAGNRPFPGGISSTTAAWFARHRPAVIRKADLVGHLNTFLLRHLTGARATDPSNASFTGFYKTLKFGGWSEELCGVAGIPMKLLPDIHPANEIGGRLTHAAADRLGLPDGVPILVGMMDTSAAMLLAGLKSGQLLNSSGSTDVLALCTTLPHPHERLLTRALGVGDYWMSVSTLAAAGSAINWVKDRLFGDLSREKFYKRLDDGKLDPAGVMFDPYLAGERTSIDQRRAGFSGLTLSTTREQMLAAVVESLAAAGAARLPLLREANPIRFNPRVVVTGGVASGLEKYLHRDWPGRWTFHHEPEATLRGLAKLAEYRPSR